MVRQFKYAAMTRLQPRLWVLGIIILINLVCTIGTRTGMLGMGMEITAIVFVSLALCGVMVVNVLSDYSIIKGVYSSPDGYAVMLTPVKTWKVLAARILAVSVLDLISLTIGIVGVVYASMNFAGGFPPIKTSNSDLFSAVIAVFILIAGYILFITTVFFAASLAKSFLYRIKGRTILAVCAALLALYVLSFLDLILVPFGYVERFGSMFYINIQMGFNIGFVLSLALYLVKVGLLFSAAAYLTERKINI